MKRSNRYTGYDFVAEYYDHVVPYRDRPDVQFYVEAARDAGGPVLELGCGTGRVAIPTARAGLDIVGLDSSRAMLSVLQRRLKGQPPDVRSRLQVAEGDMAAFHFDRSFSVITAPFRSFQHLLTVEDQIACLNLVRRHLDVGGTFVLDVFNPSLEALTRDDLGEEFGEEPEFIMPDGRRIVRTHKIIERDLLRQISRIELIYYVTHPDGREERHVHPLEMRYLFRYELEHLLERCGFELLDLYADFERKPYGSTYPGELICLARKAG
ncbi:MAG: class I SAM-dependent methyltransferase [Anaerolineales bacterium]|nr:class I SAM-dependent methyltransferase [Anaerolineales bacterium]